MQEKTTPILEVCVDSVESAMTAARAGADRLELCGDLVVGGTTPSLALYKEIRREISIPIHVLIRPRFGDFCYTEYEVRIMEQEIEAFRALGAQGVVIGALTPQGDINVDTMKRLIAAADSLSLTFHRAFDVCREPFQALEVVRTLGFHTILTSGQSDTCLEGRELLKELIVRVGDALTIMPGAGVNPRVLEELHPYLGALAYHMSGKKVIDSSMVYRKEGVSMGLKEISEYDIFRTDEQQIQKAKAILRG